MAEVKRYEVNVERDGDVWLLRVPGVDRSTQARHLGDVDAMARDLIAVMTGEPAGPGAVELDVQYAVPETAARLAEQLADLVRRIEELQAEAARVRGAVANELVVHGRMTYRDAGKLMGLSHQRVQQLVRALRAEPQSDEATFARVGLSTKVSLAS